MTWSRRVSRAAMVRAASAGTQIVCGLADAVVGVAGAGYGVHLGGELADGEPVRGWGQGEHGRQGVTHALFVQVDTADAGGAQR